MISEGSDEYDGNNLQHEATRKSLYFRFIPDSLELLQSLDSNRGGTILCCIFVGVGSKPLPHPSPSNLQLSNEPAPNFTEAIASGFDCLAAPNVMDKSWNKLALSGILAQRFGYSV
ncbi:uncharacterized protein LOC134216312 [Armigeres subalbatus]|uniref:uncharacterized protein LOC134216312 n=1 Tax=Armigeres subalbatus TaxID=124917 RepID=UPI002ED0DCF1